MPTMKRSFRSTTRCAYRALVAAALLTLPACGPLAYAGYRIAPDYPRDEKQTVDLPGLHDPVLVVLDKGGIPHIQAQNEEDLLRAVGFAQARSRFFQMDMMRRFSQGRLSELVGDQKLLSSSTIEFDVAMRGWGFGKGGDQDAASLSPSSRVMLQAFTDGINRAVELYKPLEYRLIGVEPEPWQLRDCFSLGRLNAWAVTHNWHQETSRLLLALHVGIDRAEKIYGNDFWRGGTSIEATGERHDLLPAIAPELRAMFPPRNMASVTARVPEIGEGMASDIAKLARASNGWVVSGERSASGSPILANDPHMAHMLPSLMFQQHLSAPGIDVIGGTIAGIPWVISGHNRSVAFGTTSAVGDAIDLFIERVNPSNPDQYEVDGQFRTFDHEQHVVKVRDGSQLSERRFEVRRTRHGPLMNDMYPGLFPAGAPPVAIGWNPGNLSTSIDGFGQANRATSVETLRRALSRVGTPIAAWQAADTTGTIAVFSTGTIPVRRHHRGTFPAPGWLGAYDWQGTVPAEQMPFASSKTGFFAHANNLMTDPERSPVMLHIDSAPSYRLDRIKERLAERSDHTKETMAAIQLDSKLLRARRLVPQMLAVLKSAGLQGREAKAVELLETWDDNAPVDSPAAAVFFLTYRDAVIHALRDEVDQRGFEFIMAQRYSTNVADLWFGDEHHVVWDDRATPAVEQLKDVLVPSFQRAVAKLVEEQGEEPLEWRWGAVHDLYIKHMFGSKKVLAGYVNLPRTEVAGGLDSVWKSHFDLGHPDTPFRAMAGPVYRMVIDLGDMEHGMWIVDTGSSGWPGSPHYGDQHELWKRGEYLPMTQNWSEIRADAEATITLRAAGERQTP